MGRSLSPIYSSMAPILFNYGTFGGVLGVALVCMLPLCLSSGLTWEMLPPSLLLSMLLGLPVLRSCFGISGWRGIVESSTMFGFMFCIFGGRSYILFKKLFKWSVSEMGLSICLIFLYASASIFIFRMGLQLKGFLLCLGSLNIKGKVRWIMMGIGLLLPVEFWKLNWWFFPRESRPY